MYRRLQEIAAAANEAPLPDLTPDTGSELRLMKKFRFQLLHRWLVENVPPGKVGDVGGGKGLLTYLLRQDGWDARVIDPQAQPLPGKYKNIETGQQIRIPPDARVPRIDAPFSPEMGASFDLLIGMHAHGCNIQIIDTMTQLGRRFVLLPCCIIDEPLLPPPGMHWLECVLRYALDQGACVIPFQLNFRGQNIGFYGTCENS